MKILFDPESIKAVRDKIAPGLSAFPRIAVTQPVIDKPYPEAPENEKPSRQLASEPITQIGDLPATASDAMKKTKTPPVMASSSEEKVSLRTWVAVLSTVLGAFMAVLDIQITNASLREITGGNRWVHCGRSFLGFY